MRKILRFLFGWLWSSKPKKAAERAPERKVTPKMSHIGRRKQLQADKIRKRMEKYHLYRLKKEAEREERLLKRGCRELRPTYRKEL